MTIGGSISRKFSHKYTTSAGQVEYNSYIRFIVNFKKTVESAPYSLHVKVDIKKVGNDLSTYASKWTQNYIVANCLQDKFTTIDPGLYDYYTAFHIKPTKIIYNVDLDMNTKTILNIAADQTQNNSAATVKMV